MESSSSSHQHNHHHRPKGRAGDHQKDDELLVWKGKERNFVITRIDNCLNISNRNVTL